MTATGTVIPPLHKDIGSFGLFHYRNFFAFGHNALCVRMCDANSRSSVYSTLACLSLGVSRPSFLPVTGFTELSPWLMVLGGSTGKVGQPTYAHLRSVLPCLPILAVERGCGSSNPTCTIQTLAECLLGGLTQVDP